jgi:hypothetical protein
VLNVEQGLGWTTFQYITNLSDQYFTFDNNSRAGIAGEEQQLMEIEVEDLDSDAVFTNVPPFEGQAITCSFITSMFQSQGGSDVIEHEWLSLMAKVVKTIVAIPFVNGVTWPDSTTSKVSDFVLDPAFFSALDQLNDREHRLFIAPEAQGVFLFNRMIGNYLSYEITTVAPCIFKSQRLHCIIDEDGIAWGNFDPYQILPDSTGFDTIVETGDATDTITETGTATNNILEGL